MELYFLVDAEFFSELDEDAVEGIEVVAVVAACGCEVQDDQIIVSMVPFERLMILIPLCNECFLTGTLLPLDDQGGVFLCGDVHVEPLLDHEVVFFEAVAGLILVEAKHDIGSAA